MFFHEDLNLYKNPNFRSYEYINQIWNLLENDLIYSIGLINNGNITIVIDPGICFMTVTSNFNHIFDQKYHYNFQHSINYCEDFSIEIELCIINSKKYFLCENESCKLYFLKNNLGDEGIIEYSSSVNLNVINYNDFKVNIFLNLVREIQYAINRNILNLDIHDYDSVIAEIDSDYEITRTYSFLKRLKTEDSLDYLCQSNRICKDNKDLIRQIIKNI